MGTDKVMSGGAPCNGLASHLRELNYHQSLYGTKTRMSSSMVDYVAQMQTYPILVVDCAVF